MIHLFGSVDASVFVSLAAAILGAGGVGSAVAYRKAGAESDNIAAQTLIAVNKELRAEIARQKETLAAEINGRDEQIRTLRERVAVLESLVLRRSEG